MLSDIINGPEKWVKCDFAKSATGLSVSPHDPNAVCWCAVGAIVRYSEIPGISGKSQERRRSLAEKSLLEAALKLGLCSEEDLTGGYCTIFKINDNLHTTFETVKAWLELADSLMLEDSTISGIG